MRILLIILLFPLALQAQKKDTTVKPSYYLIGTLPDFQLLYKAVSDPDNITRKQTADLILWINSAKMILTDSTKKEKLR